jgi:photosystem II stability/assembly factor-like uncharacterized protein
VSQVARFFFPFTVLLGPVFFSHSADSYGATGRDPMLAPARQGGQAVHGVLLDGVADGSRIFVVGEHGAILISNDAGSSWSQASVPVQVTLTGIALEGHLGWVVGHDAAILHTKDGGETWAIQNFDPDVRAPLLDVWFSGVKRGIAVGANGLVMLTEDSGKTWQKSVISQSDGFTPHLFKITQVGDALYIAAEQGSIFKSIDMGKSWAALESPYQGSLFGVAKVPGGGAPRLVVYGMLGHAFFSDDGGVKWSRIHSGVDESIYDHGISEDGSLLLVGAGGRVLVSRDSGSSFIPMQVNTNMAISAVLPVSTQPGTMLLVGSGGLVSSQIVGRDTVTTSLLDRVPE